jgi:MFS family permease
MAGKREFYGWKLVAVLFSLDFLNMGFPYFGGAVINTYMLKEIAMSRGMFGLGFTLANLFIGLPSVIVAASILKWGIKRTFGIGSVLIIIGTVWLAFFTTKPWQYLVGFGLIIGTGICFSTIVPVTTTVTRWFRRYRGRAMAIPLSASGFAGFVGSPLINKILTLNGGDWRQAWETVAGIAVLSGIIAFLFVKERPEDLGQIVDGVEEDSRATAPTAAAALITRHAWTPAAAMRTTSYWMIVIGGVASQFPYFFFVAHGILHMKGAGLSAATAAWAMGLFTMGTIIGRQTGGWLMDKMPARYAFMSGLCCYFAGSLLAMRINADALAVAFAAAILYGIGFGWTFICLNTATAHFFGPAAYPKLNGMNLLVGGLLSSPAGFIGGRLFDLYRSYTLGFELNMLVAAIGIAALAFATMPQPKSTAVTEPARTT